MRRPARLSQPLTLAVVLAVAATAGCGGSDYVDTDATPQTAMGLPTALGVEGDVDFDKGDKVDWKQMTAREDGKATITVRVGDAFAGTHNVKGRIVVYDRDANQYASASIEPNLVKYALSWEVKKDTAYLVKIQADSGKAPYAIELTVELEEQDPCANVECGDKQACKDGQCFDIELDGACNPECRSGYRCDDGECVAASRTHATARSATPASTAAAASATRSPRPPRRRGRAIPTATSRWARSASRVSASWVPSARPSCSRSPRARRPS